MSLSPVTITGNLTSDPEIRYFDSGASKLSFSVAVNNFWTDAKGEKKEKASFFDVVAWRNLAEDGAGLLAKGVRVTVTGRLEQESWDDKETGKKRSAVHVLADEIGISVRSIEKFDRKVRQQAEVGAKEQGRPRSQPKQPARVGSGSQQESFEGEEPF
jgi:single-strand DNA-binding protein